MGTGAVSRYKVVSEPEISHGAGFKLRADASVRVQQPLQICLWCRSKSKNRDKQLTHIVRVMGQALFICLGAQMFFLLLGPCAEILLCRREGEKF